VNLKGECREREQRKSIVGRGSLEALSSCDVEVPAISQHKDKKGHHESRNGEFDNGTTRTTYLGREN
jgi:hypothetical protein